MRGKRGSRIFFYLAVILIPVIITGRMSGTYGIAERKREAEGAYIIRGEERIPLEEYLTGAVAYYMPLEYEDEAYKAMAVLLRTYIAKTMGDENEVREELLSLESYCLEEMRVIFGEQFSHQYSRYQTAVRSTAGEVIRWEKELIEPYFHKVSAGMTNTVPDCPYLVSVESRQDIQAKNYLFLKTVSAQEFAEGMSLAGAEAWEWQEGEEAAYGLLEDMTLVRSAGEYVDSVMWKGKELLAARVQEVFELPSPAFQFEVYEGNIRIMTKGIGHGVGVSLYGANGMAQEGRSYKEILTHYYTNITVSDE